MTPMTDSAINIREATLRDTDDIVRFQQSMALETDAKMVDDVLPRQGVVAACACG